MISDREDVRLYTLARMYTFEKIYSEFVKLICVLDIGAMSAIHKNVVLIFRNT